MNIRIKVHLAQKSGLNKFCLYECCCHFVDRRLAQKLLDQTFLKDL